MTKTIPLDKIVLELIELRSKKSHDYGSNGDPMANLRAATEIGLSPVIGVVLRMADKWFRIRSWANGNKLVNDSVRDDFIDIAGYALRAVELLDEQLGDKS